MRRAVFIAAAIAVLDQITKLLVTRLIDPQYPVVVIRGFFRLVHWTNTGAAWGMFQGFNWVLAIVSVLTILALYFFRHSFHFHLTGSQVALGMIAGGITGNVIDRVRLGFVVDFLDFHIGDRHWPAFNVADTAICLGVALYIIVSWRAERKAR